VAAQLGWRRLRSAQGNREAALRRGPNRSARPPSPELAGGAGEPRRPCCSGMGRIPRPRRHSARLGRSSSPDTPRGPDSATPLTLLATPRARRGRSAQLEEVTRPPRSGQPEGATTPWAEDVNLKKRRPGPARARAGLEARRFGTGEPVERGVGIRWPRSTPGRASGRRRPRRSADIAFPSNPTNPRCARASPPPAS
jgi:hypothetical protein